MRPVLEDEFSEDSDTYEEDKVITRAAQEFRPLMIDSREGGLSHDEVSPVDPPLDIWASPHRVPQLNIGDGGGAECWRQIREFWGGYEMFVNVRWLNEPGDHEIAMAYQAWLGNETETGWSYSHVALLIVVPLFSERKLDGK